MTKRRILLLGWDAADWQVIDPLLDAGLMPNLARLVNRGVVGNLATLHPPYSPILWTSIATGKRPTRHGIHGFQEPTPDGTAVRPASSLSRTCKALWNIATQQGLTSVVVSWYPSHPVEPISGVMVSDLFGKAGEGATPGALPPQCIHPPEWTGRLEELRITPRDLPAAVLRTFVPDFDKVDQAADRRLHMLAKVVAENMNIHAAATEALEHTGWDLACVFYDGIDHLSHGFARYHPPRPAWIKEDDFALYRNVLAAGYCWHDAMLGRLLELAGDDTTVILVSDHGFECGAQRLPDMPMELAGPTQDHRHFGIVAMAGPGIRRDDRVYGASLLDITPTILHLMGLPVGRDMDGKVLLTALDNPAGIQRIPSWEDVPGEAGMHPPDATLDPLAAVEAMKQLVALGYVAPPGDDIAAWVNEAILEQHYTLAQSHDDEGRPDLAAAQFVNMLAVRPGDHRAFAGLVSAHLRLGETEEAAAVLDRFDAAATAAGAAARAELTKREAEAPLASFAGKHDPATLREMADRRKMTQDTGDRAPARMLLRVRLALAEGRKQDGLRGLEALRAACAGSGAAIESSALAGLYAEAGDADHAMVFCEAALKRNAQDWRSLSLRARLHLQSGRAEAAIADAAASLGLIYFQPGLHMLLGQARASLGAYEEAARDLRVAVMQAPGLMAAHQALADMYTRRLNLPEQAAVHVGNVTYLKDRAGRRRTAAEPEAAEAGPDRPVFPARPLRQAPDGRAPVLVVTGLPRSGTSMLMQALAAGGIAALTDGERAADADNPRGYFEFTRATRLPADSEWLPQARGHAVKLVLPLLPHLPRGEAYGLILIQRDLREVTASQAAMLDRLGRDAANLTPRALSTQYVRQERVVRAWLETRPGIGVLPLRYDEVLADPLAAAGWIAAFLHGAFAGGAFDAAACAGAIDPGLRRQRA